ncbi:hypothetical protein [Nitrosomonas sp. Nm33]|uniref:hypothetical protein n=1 Tax=Nitrosomonas sp. Nm33 TaxID=133724 RepID=UPI0008998DB6|nr:hypothetical protein [Nitrosomonas sp. Nm33]SDY72088.1 hypothetical protein SAMN05421755_104221 [Nitrosomonas sp. Nm33]
MNLHLLIPGLFWPEAGRSEVYGGLSLSALEVILAKSHCAESQSQGIEEWLCQTFGVSKQQDWPIAPIMLQLDGTDEKPDQNEYWLRADPVHLRIQNNHMLLADSQVFSISLKESIQFADTLNQYFSKSGIVFLPLHPDRWYVRIAKIPCLQTRLLSEMIGKNINNLLPIGEDSSAWHSIFNEIQMLLHTHPLNQEREERGEFAINSIWFWGGGMMPQNICSTFNQIWCDHTFTHALAVASGIASNPLPHDATMWQRQAKPGNHLVVLDTLWGKTQYRNIYEWRECLSSFEQRWFIPLLEAMKKRVISQLTITVLNEDSTRNFIMSHNSLWKFWARAKSLSSYGLN